MAKPVYEPSTKLVGQQPSGDRDTRLAASTDGLRQPTPPVIEAIDSRPVAQEVVQRFGLRMNPSQPVGNLAVEQVRSTSFTQPSHKGADPQGAHLPQRAHLIANTVCEESSERVSQVRASANDITATVWQSALAPSKECISSSNPVSPDPVRNGILALVFRLMLGVGLALLADYTDYRWRSSEEVEQTTSVPLSALYRSLDRRLVKDKTKKGNENDRSPK